MCLPCWPQGTIPLWESAGVQDRLRQGNVSLVDSRAKEEDFEGWKIMSNQYNFATISDSYGEGEANLVGKPKVVTEKFKGKLERENALKDSWYERTSAISCQRLLDLL